MSPLFCDDSFQAEQNMHSPSKMHSGPGSLEQPPRAECQFRLSGRSGRLLFGRIDKTPKEHTADYRLMIKQRLEDNDSPSSLLLTHLIVNLGTERIEFLSHYIPHLVGSNGAQAGKVIAYYAKQNPPKEDTKPSIIFCMQHPESMDVKELITTLGIHTVVSFNFPLPMDKPLDMSRFHDRASIDIWTKDPEQQKAVHHYHDYNMSIYDHLYRLWEAGVSQSLGALQDDMRWWFSASDHQVKIVLLVKFDLLAKNILVSHLHHRPCTLIEGARLCEREDRACQWISQGVVCSQMAVRRKGGREDDCNYRAKTGGH
jgi:hypothetical protein